MTTCVSTVRVWTIETAASGASTETLTHASGFNGMNTFRILAALTAPMILATTLCAQPPFGGRGGDRGDFGGRGGGPPGGGFGDRGGFGGRGGGPPGGGFGDRGGFGGRGGGPPGGGFGDRGGDRGGRGGDRGGGGGPSDFLSRLDRNGNGVLDPDEQQGPAQFLIGRLQREDSSIRPGSPIPISKVTSAFEKMRGGGGDSRDRRDSRSDPANDAMEVELLVPGFDAVVEFDPILGFGPNAEMLAVPVSDADRREATERMQRYDRNKDGFLSSNEMERFSGDPMAFDRNKDGKLSLDELAVRYARRREAREDDQQRRDSDRRRSDDREDSEPVDRYDGRKSYRIIAGDGTDGLPGWFIDRDGDKDGQVLMSEYTSEWTDAVVKEFNGWDRNGDGTITSDEARIGVERGPVSSGGGSPAPSSIASSSSSSSATANATAGDVEVSDRDMAYAERIVKRYDANGDGVLVPSEYENMLMKPTGADTDRDGRVSIREYAESMARRRAQ
ncbi:EF hand [Crateriforma conspicua]|nr:EF hand [Crateriforma conspicua]